MNVCVEACAPCRARNFEIRPRIDLKVNEEEPIGIEEEKDFVKPVKDLCGFIRPRRLEIAFLGGAHSGSVRHYADESFGRLDQGFFPCGAASENSDIGSMFKELKHWKQPRNTTRSMCFLVPSPLDVELYIPV